MELLKIKILKIVTHYHLYKAEKLLFNAFKDSNYTN